ncbi:DUF6879 family protein [Streptomyces sp. NPDC052036]|uniref:DUF6879 family protein n=1 Tax=unclassified Streptomyces TaxID=2593676 RepID=UPI003429D060
MSATQGTTNTPRPEGLRVPPLLLKTLVTVVVSIIAYVLTNALNQKQDEVWKLTISIVIGGSALIVQYMVDFERRLETMESGQRARIREMKDSLSEHHREVRGHLGDHRRELTDLVDDRFARISEATELFSQVDRSVLRSDGVTKLARSATKAGLLNNELVKTFASEEIDRLAQLLENLSNNIADCLGENQDWLIDLTRCIKKSLDATSTSVDRDFWNSEPASRYLEAQSDAILRGVKIRRLFIVETEREIDDRLTELCESQRSLGIDARVVALSQLPHRVQLGTHSDFIIFDNELTYEIDQDTKRVNAKTTLNARAALVEHRMKRFNRLWEATQDLSG